jgi:hypothetical protein
MERPVLQLRFYSSNRVGGSYKLRRNRTNPERCWRRSAPEVGPTDCVGWMQVPKRGSYNFPFGRTNPKRSSRSELGTGPTSTPNN